MLKQFSHLNVKDQNEIKTVKNKKSLKINLQKLSTNPFKMLLR
jgi:hypothetical protein